MVTKGSCVALLFANHVAYPIDSVLSIAPPFATVPVTPEIQTMVYLGHLKNAPLSPAASRFVEYCMMRAQINSK